MASKAEALYKKKLAADKAAMEADSGENPSDTYTEDQETIAAANAALEAGGTFNKVAGNRNEKEFRAFLKMTNEQKKKFIESRGK